MESPTSLALSSPERFLVGAPNPITIQLTSSWGPLVDMRVWLSVDDNFVDSAITDSNGRCTFEVFFSEVGTYQLGFLFDGYTDPPVKTWKMAFIIIEKDGVKATQEMFDKANEIRFELSKRFLEFTRGLGFMDTSYPPVAIPIADIMTMEGFYNVTKTFYKSNPDIFQFITFLPTVLVNAGWHSIVSSSNYTYWYPRPTPKSPQLIGTQLTGTVLFSTTEQSIHFIMHETMHRWGAIKYVENGISMSDHLNSSSPSHYSKKLITNGATYIGGGVWRENSDGTFTTRLQPRPRSEFNFNLWLMGLITREEVNPVRLIKSEYTDLQINPGTGRSCPPYTSGCETIPGYIKEITADQWTP